MVDLEKGRVLASPAVCEGGTAMCQLKSHLSGLGAGGQEERTGEGKPCFKYCGLYAPCPTHIFSPLICRENLKSRYPSPPLKDEEAEAGDWRLLTAESVLAPVRCLWSPASSGSRHLADDCRAQLR